LQRGYRRIGMLCIILFLLVVAYGTTNRGVWLYLLIELAVFGGLYLFRVDLKPKTKKKVIAIIAVSMVVSTGTLLLAAKSRLGLVGGPTEIITGTAQADPRPQLWNDSATLILQRPYTGAGFGTMVLGREMQQQQQNINHTHAHNIFLNYALQLGFLGPFVLIFIFYSAGREFWKLVKSTEKALQMLGIAGLAMVSGVLAAGMIEDLFGRHLGWLFWALTGMILGYSTHAARPISTSQPPPK
jgi:O-antigen ligase